MFFTILKRPLLKDTSGILNRNPQLTEIKARLSEESKLCIIQANSPKTILKLLAHNFKRPVAGNTCGWYYSAVQLEITLRNLPQHDLASICYLQKYILKLPNNIIDNLAKLSTQKDITYDANTTKLFYDEKLAYFWVDPNAITHFSAVYINPEIRKLNRNLSDVSIREDKVRCRGCLIS